LTGALGIPGRLFGDLVRPGTRLGPLRPELCAKLGVTPFGVVAVGGHDTASAVAAVPMVDDTPCAYLSSGTWSLMGVESAAPVITDATYAIPFTNEGGVENTIRLLRNIGGLWLVQECRRHWAARGEDITFADLNQRAAEAEPFVAVIDPDDAVFAAPGDMPDKICAFAEKTGQRVPQSKGEIVRTALESLALRYRWVFERLEQVGGRRLERLHIVGGGSQNQVLNQFTANAVGRPVLAGPVEATVIGNMLMQMMAAGAIGSLAEGRRLVADSFGTEVYQPTDAAAWDAAYARFLEVVPS
jgi:rhamnulokinase